MNFQVVTLMPELIESYFVDGVLSKALKKSLIQLNCINPRDFATDVHKTVDDRPFGGGDGMLMKVEPLAYAISKAKENLTGSLNSQEDKSLSKNRSADVYKDFDQKQTYFKTFLLSPKGRKFDNEFARECSRLDGLVLVSGRYGGVDQRLINELIDEEISIGDYVLSGGELAANVVIDSVARFLPGILGHKESAEKDSLEGHLLEAPLFTRPREIFSQAVPGVFLSGDHVKIEKIRSALSVLMTKEKRPDLWAKFLEKNPDGENRAKQALELVDENLSAEEKKHCGLSPMPFG